MKIIKNIFLLLIAMFLTSCNNFISTPTMNPTNMVETAISIVTTNISETQTAIPTATSTPFPPTPTIVYQVISRNNVPQISQIGRWQTNPSLKIIWNDDSTEIFMPELFDIVNVYNIPSGTQRQISLNEYKQLNPTLFTDETAEQGNCSSFWVRQTNLISPDKTILVTGWSYGHKQPQKTVINLWNLVEKKVHITTSRI